ncbi:DNA breaking-rejoining enzyme [Mycena rosella]|uniref:DNA breaking-rejoining enzyme n=2 Tax=Mycena rosella TaxID=1033263 RepID=A0AAD7CH52_MYCRO|nr:DNA breaking-rejoining enzyme [Mycena rosella]
MSGDVPPVFAALYQAIHAPSEADRAHADEVTEDIEAEGETIPDDAELEEDTETPGGFDITKLQENLLEASKGVTNETDKEYKRCDEINFDGTTKPTSQVRDSYNHAQKMRASMTYAFGRLCGLGSLPWHASEVSQRMVGNPSVSETVATYMTSLRRRKVRAGEVATSARAITQETLRKVYDFNHQPEVAEIKEYAAGSRKQMKGPHEWGGGRARRLLHLAYVLAFLCLLRFDEVLKIQMQDIEWVSETCIKLTLPYRKTNQFGGVKPFYLHLLPPHLAHLCPVRALAEWLIVSGITDGYLFRKIVSGDRVSEQNSHMTSDFFLEMFRNNLLDVGINPYPYGTHSFRRGGCQWLYTCCRWGLRRICDWGGWSTELSNLTIVKYLISYVDEPSERREDYMNPNRPPSLKCFSCGRTCHCI